MREEAPDVELAALDRKLVQVSFLVRLLHDVLLDRVPAHEPVYVHRPCLPDPVAPILGLVVHRWVPIAIIENHSISPRQVDAHASAPCGENEGEDLVIRVETLRVRLPLLRLGASVQPKVRVVVQIQE